jgi:hypothetical protein
MNSIVDDRLRSRAMHLLRRLRILALDSILPGKVRPGIAWRIHVKRTTVLAPGLAPGALILAPNRVR